MNYGELITTSRDCEVMEIPSGYRGSLPGGSSLRIMQSLGGTFTVMTNEGHMLRIDAKDADAIGQTVETQPVSIQAGAFDEKLVWEQLRAVYDPEIPVNIVDLGLVYSCDIISIGENMRKVDIKMSMTAPGCGMGDVLKTDVKNKVSLLPGVKEVDVEVVFDPPWNPGMMSDAAKLKLGFM